MEDINIKLILNSFYFLGFNECGSTKGSLGARTGLTPCHSLIFTLDPRGNMPMTCFLDGQIKSY